jgi:polysaccharide chain length determinant protein (PEP-CTERM system associated)
MNIQALTPEDFLRIPLKRKWWILTSVVVCMALAYLASLYFPKTFKSTIVLTVDSPRIAKEYVKGLSQDGRHDDPIVAVIQQINLELTNKSILIPVLDTLKPYHNGKSEEKTSDGLIKRLRKSIVVERAKEGVGVAVTYVHSDPYMAQAVLALLAVKLQEENLKRREDLMETTTEFLSAELDRVKQELDIKEREISDFKRAHMGELPQLMDANLRTLDRLQIDLTNSSKSLNMLEERLNAIERSIKEFPDLGPTGIITGDRDRRGGDTRLINPRATRLQELKQTLNELLGTYKDNYPDVVQVRKEIRRLESALQVDESQPSNDERAAGKADDSGGNARMLTDPYVRQMMRERSEVKSEIAFEREKQARLRQQIKDIEARIEHTPAREQGLAMLLRDYENLQSSYQALLQKRTNARLLGNYESRQFGEQYRLIEPASLPLTPQPPTQIHFLLGGLVLGCLLGFGSAFGLEILKTGFRRVEEIEHHLGLPVIATIPAFASVMKDGGTRQVRAMLTGPEKPAGTPEDALLAYLGSRNEGASLKLGIRKSLNTDRDLPLKFSLIAKWFPASLISEQYRVAATRLILMTTGKTNVVTLVTSSVMGEGKTTTAVNLAYVLAHDLGKSTLLIDCDFKCPMVHELLGIPAGLGLGDVLQGGEILENCLHRYDSLPLWILPSGLQRVTPAGLAGIQYVKTILPDLRTHYDYVILDAPPVIPLADVNILTGISDMTAFVVRACGTSQDVARKALRTLGESADTTAIIMTHMEQEYSPYFMYGAAYVNRYAGAFKDDDKGSRA